MIKNTQKSQSNSRVRWIKIFLSSWVFLLAFVYLIFVQRQYVDIVFESQFLHINFLRDISSNQITAKGFFTVFGEHLFPGYNIILAINYYLFGLWGGFDGIVHAISLLVAAIFVVIAIWRSSIEGVATKTLISIIATSLLLSPTNNPQWGMALAASIGVTLFVLSVFLIETALDNNLEKINPFAYVALSFAIVFFLGGYAIGAVAAIFLLLIVWVAKNRVFDSKIALISILVFLCLIVYTILVNRYGSLLVNKPTGESFDIRLIGNFLLLMTGSSLLGKAFFELTHYFLPYYICGVVLLFWVAFVFVDFLQRPVKGQLFILAIATYSIVNMLAVSIFRFKNGIEGAMGQWYNSHTHFIAVAVCFYLISSLRRGKYFIVSIVKILSLSLIFIAAAVGYYCDWRKSEYISGWKQQFVEQAPVLLAFPDLIQDKSDSFNSMLWNYSEAKSGVDLLYEKNLWIFKKNTPIITGLDEDGWLVANRPVMILCPVGSKSLRLHVWRPDGWNKSMITARYDNKLNQVLINNEDIVFAFSHELAAVLLDANDRERSNPVISNGDDRSLVAIIKNISCDFPLK